MKLCIGILGVLLFAAIANGCGGGGGSVSKTEYIGQADKICTEAEKTKNTELKVALKEASKSEQAPSTKDQEAIVLTVLQPISQMTEELSDLEAPSGEEQQVDEIVESFEATVKKLEADPGSAIQPGSEPFEEADDLAQKYGLKSCDEV